MAQGAANFTIQLNSATAKKGTGEHYVMPLDPPINVPYLAKPRAQLESLSFSNSFSNVDASTLNNNAVKLAWYSNEGSLQTTDITIDDGFYDLQHLEIALAKKLRNTELWTAMNTYCAANAGYNETDPNTASTIYFDCKGVIVTGNGTGSSLMADATLAHGKLILPVKNASLELWRKKQDGTNMLFSQPPDWLIGSVLKTATHGVTNALSAMNLAAGYKIVAVHKLAVNPGLPGQDSINVELEAGYGVELSPAGTAVTSLINVPGVDTATVRVAFTPPGVSNASFRGYAVKGLAHPSLDADSGWGGTLNVQDLETVLATASQKSNDVVVGATAITVGMQQYERYIKPITFDVDIGTNKLRVYFAWPGVYVLKESSLFTNMLGFNDDDLASPTPTAPQSARQNPFSNDTVLAVAAVTNRTANKSTSEILINRVRSLSFNCPSLVPASYGTDGKLSQSQMASVPVLVGPSQVQSYQAGHDDSVPATLHGAYISEIEFFLTDQAGTAVDLQKSTFQATLRVFYPDPVHPRVGTAGAEMDETIGLRDVTFRY